MYFYTAYGLNVYSDLKLPELVTSKETKADVIIRLGKLNNSPSETKSTVHCFQLTAEGMYLFWVGIGTFLIREGKEIIIDPVSEIEESRLRLFILGAAIGVILHQRGFLVLHASAIAVHGNAVAFIGDKGWGKSTMAAVLYSRGHSLLADDVVALDLKNSRQPLVIPAFPQLKLWPDAVASMGANPEELPRLAFHLEKRDCRLTHGFILSPLPLKHIYLLGKGNIIEIQPLQSQDIFTYLIRNSYITRFGDEMLKLDRTSHFLQLTWLAKQVSIRRLLRPADPSLLPAIAELVEKQLADNLECV